MDVASAARAVGLRFVPDRRNTQEQIPSLRAAGAAYNTIVAADLTDPENVARVLRFASRIAELHEAGAGAHRDMVVRLRNCLHDDGYALDAPGDPLAAIAGLAATATAALADAAAIRQELTRLERALPDDTGALIGRAKNLIEATAKAVLALRGEPVSDKDEVPALVAKASQALGVHVTQAAGPQLDQVKRILSRLHPLTQNVAELRNKVGDGHGMTGVPAVDAAVGRLAARSAIAWCAFMLEVAMSGRGAGR
ncbi:Abortive infection C-terminus [Micromonospora eburnea]|uniref:Abortive infection C-terminus n=2 Tax=Micromonospora eburnea TaxID=227316 RepID=A0A1C6TVY9_9ACTN|nr:Abortive infection C-terminus [Micromonospora eburnea]